MNFWDYVLDGIYGDNRYGDKRNGFMDGLCYCLFQLLLSLIALLVVSLITASTIGFLALIYATKGLLLLPLLLLPIVWAFYRYKKGGFDKK